MLNIRYLHYASACSHFVMYFVKLGPVITSKTYDKLVIHRSNGTEQWKKTLFKGKKKKKRHSLNYQSFCCNKNMDTDRGHENPTLPLIHLWSGLAVTVQVFPDFWGSISSCNTLILSVHFWIATFISSDIIFYYTRPKLT